MDAERIRKEIIELIDKHWNNWVKAAFYSDPEVAKIMDRLVREWSSRGEEGAPIDYATEDELLVLLRAARKYYSMDPRRAMAVALSNMAGAEDESEGGLFRRVFSRGRREASP